MRTRIATPKPNRTTTRRRGEVRPGADQGGTQRRRPAAPAESTFRRVAVFLPPEAGEVRDV